MDLFQVARGNAESFSQRYEAVRAAAGVAAVPLECFVATVWNNGRLAVNLRPTVLLRCSNACPGSRGRSFSACG